MVKEIGPATPETVEWIASMLEEMAVVVRAHPPTRCEISTDRHRIDTNNGVWIERTGVGMSSFQLSMGFPPGVNLPATRPPSGLDSRLSEVRSAIGTDAMHVICHPDDESRVRAALVVYPPGVSLRSDSELKRGTVVVVNKYARLDATGSAVRVVGLPESSDTEQHDATDHDRDKLTGVRPEQCLRCNHSLSDHNSESRACTWYVGGRRSCRCPKFTTDIADLPEPFGDGPARGAREMLDYWAGP
jgi:hypothetical protein